ncbi:hypothetical protein DRP04_13315 [Archaeoglobales archaeon]|nr:MAG: hypothetical protein DRP04_13315 [Archaeoglobales archaeon]
MNERTDEFRPEEVLLNAIKNAAKKANFTLIKILEVQLESKEGKGLELAFENPSKFIESVKDLFGEYSGRFFELLIVQELVQSLGLKDRPDNLLEAVELLKKVSGSV